jgi:hypothetical protein
MTFPYLDFLVKAGLIPSELFTPQHDLATSQLIEAPLNMDIIKAIISQQDNPDFDEIWDQYTRLWLVTHPSFLKLSLEPNGKEFVEYTPETDPLATILLYYYTQTQELHKLTISPYYSHISPYHPNALKLDRVINFMSQPAFLNFEELLKMVQILFDNHHTFSNTPKGTPYPTLFTSHYAQITPQSLAFFIVWDYLCRENGPYLTMKPEVLEGDGINVPNFHSYTLVQNETRTTYTINQDTLDNVNCPPNAEIVYDSFVFGYDLKRQWWSAINTVRPFLAQFFLHPAIPNPAKLVDGILSKGPGASKTELDPLFQSTTFHPSTAKFLGSYLYQDLISVTLFSPLLDLFIHPDLSFVKDTRNGNPNTPVTSAQLTDLWNRERRLFSTPNPLPDFKYQRQIRSPLVSYESLMVEVLGSGLYINWDYYKYLLLQHPNFSQRISLQYFMGESVFAHESPHRLRLLSMLMCQSSPTTSGDKNANFSTHCSPILHHCAASGLTDDKVKAIFSVGLNKINVNNNENGWDIINHLLRWDRVNIPQLQWYLKDLSDYIDLNLLMKNHQREGYYLRKETLRRDNDLIKPSYETIELVNFKRYFAPPTYNTLEFAIFTNHNWNELKLIFDFRQTPAEIDIEEVKQEETNEFISDYTFGNNTNFPIQFDNIPNPNLPASIPIPPLSSRPAYISPITEARIKPGDRIWSLYRPRFHKATLKVPSTILLNILEETSWVQYGIITWCSIPPVPQDPSRYSKSDLEKADFSEGIEFICEWAVDEILRGDDSADMNHIFKIFYNIDSKNYPIHKNIYTKTSSGGVICDKNNIKWPRIDNHRPFEHYNPFQALPSPKEWYDDAFPSVIKKTPVWARKSCRLGRD